MAFASSDVILPLDRGQGRQADKNSIAASICRFQYTHTHVFPFFNLSPVYHFDLHMWTCASRALFSGCQRVVVLSGGAVRSLARPRYSLRHSVVVLASVAAASASLSSLSSCAAGDGHCMDAPTLLGPGEPTLYLPRQLYTREQVCERQRWWWWWATG